MLASLRLSVYEMLHAPRTAAHRVVQWVVVGLIVLLILDAILTGQPFYNAFTSSPVGRWAYLALWCIFIAEYLLRVWSIAEREPDKPAYQVRVRYIFTFFSLIDLVVVVSMAPWVTANFSLLRAFRTLRIFSVLKLGRYSAGLQLFGRVFVAKRGELVASLTIVAVLLLLASSLMHVLEAEAQPDVFGTVLSSLWWGIITLTTVGYGDAAPVTAIGQLAGGLIALLGIGVAAMPAGIIVAGIQQEFKD